MRSALAFHAGSRDAAEFGIENGNKLTGGFPAALAQSIHQTRNPLWRSPDRFHGRVLAVVQQLRAIDLRVAMADGRFVVIIIWVFVAIRLKDVLQLTGFQMRRDLEASRPAAAKWKHAYEVFERALEVPESERRLFARSATEDADVLGLVLMLIDRHEQEAGEQAGSDQEAGGRDGGLAGADIRAGDRIGRYEIVDKLGQGGMGCVYSARDPELDRMVALKVLPSHVAATPAASERLVREAKAASALNHPQIVTVHEVIRTGADVAIAMELVEGKSLRTYCGEPQAGVRVMDWGRQIAEALAAAHNVGIVHRDIKPENLMLRTDGHIKLLDFGLARQVMAAGQASATNASWMPAGTLNYMSPEQTRGETVTSASDVFSLGVVLYELATGHHPFLCDSPIDTAHAIAHDAPRGSSELSRRVSPVFTSLISSMLAKDPGKRPSAAEVASRLTAMIETERKREPRRVKHWLWLYSLAACVVLGFALWAITERILAPKEPLFQQITMQAAENTVTAAALSPNGEELAFGTLGGPTYVRRMSDGFTRPLPTPDGLQVDRIAWFADGSRLLASGMAADYRRGVWMIPVNGGAPSPIGPEGRDGVPSPDGTRIALTSADGTAIWVIGVNGGRPRQIRGGRGTGWFSALLWSPDGKRISYERQEYTPPNDPGSAPAELARDYAYAYEATDVNTGRVVASVRDLLMTSACELEDGRVLFVRWIPRRREQGDVHQLCEIRTDPKTGEVLGPPHPVTQISDSEFLGLSSISAAYGGSKIAVVRSSAQQRPNIYIADLPPGREVSKLLNIRRLTFMLAEEYPHAWTPDNGAVIFESNRNGNFGIFRQKIDEREPEPLVLSKNAANVLAQVSPDERWVLYREDREQHTKTRFMRVPMKGGTPEPLLGTESVEDFRCGQQPGSRCVLRSTENDQFVFYELDPLRGRGRELARTAWGPTTTEDWDISPDGRFAAMPNHNPQAAIIRVISLDASRAEAAERVVTINGMKNLNGLVWAANGEGWYAVEKTPLGLVMFYVDADGAHSWELLRAWSALWAVPSPDGRKIAFPQDAPWSNAYLVNGFR
jgi:Tol biopolymer transport system component